MSTSRPAPAPAACDAYMAPVFVFGAPPSLDNRLSGTLRSVQLAHTSARVMPTKLYKRKKWTIQRLAGPAAAASCIPPPPPPLPLPLPSAAAFAPFDSAAAAAAAAADDSTAASFLPPLDVLHDTFQLQLQASLDGTDAFSKLAPEWDADTFFVTKCDDDDNDDYAASASAAIDDTLFVEKCDSDIDDKVDDNNDDYAVSASAAIDDTLFVKKCDNNDDYAASASAATNDTLFVEKCDSDIDDKVDDNNDDYAASTSAATDDTLFVEKCDIDDDDDDGDDYVASASAPTADTLFVSNVSKCSLATKRKNRPATRNRQTHLSDKNDEASRTLLSQLFADGCQMAHGRACRCEQLNEYHAQMVQQIWERATANTMAKTEMSLSFYDAIHTKCHGPFLEKSSPSGHSLFLCHACEYTTWKKDGVVRHYRAIHLRCSQQQSARYKTRRPFAMWQK